MRLSDVMSGADLTLWPKLALGIFLVTFAAILVREWLRNRDEIRHASQLPLQDDEIARPTHTPGGWHS